MLAMRQVRWNLFLKEADQMNQSRIASYSVVFGAMVLSLGLCFAYFLARAEIPPFIVMFLTVIGTGFMTAGLLFDHRVNHFNGQGKN